MSGDVRKDFPNAAKIVDEFSEVFGRDQIMVYFAQEGAKTRGKRGEVGLPMSKMIIGDFRPIKQKCEEMK